MARDSVSKWSTNPDENLDVGNINIGENCPPSNINNALREIMAEARRDLLDSATDNVAIATPSQKGLLDALSGTAGQIVRVNEAGTAYECGSLTPEVLPPATATTLGIVKPDGKSTFVDATGTLSASGVPLLSISWELCTAALPGKLNLSLDNDLLSRSAWVDAWAEIQATRADLILDDAAWLAEVAAQGSCAKFSSGDGSTTFRVPLLRRVYARAADPVSGLVAGMWQDCQFETHAHYIDNNAGTDKRITSGTGTGPTMNGASANWSTNANAAAVMAGSAASGRSGTETRPVSVVLTPYMQMYGVTTNAGALDIAALAQGVATKLDVTRYQDDRAADAPFKVRAWAVVQTNSSTILASQGIAAATRSGGTVRYTLSTPAPHTDYFVSGSLNINDVAGATLGFVIQDSRVSTTTGKTTTQFSVLGWHNSTAISGQQCVFVLY